MGKSHPASDDKPELSAGRSSGSESPAYESRFPGSPGPRGWPRARPFDRPLEPTSRRHPAFQYYKRLRRARRYVLENLSRSMSLAEVARAAGSSRSHFSRFFRKRVGIGFAEWLRELRVQRAKRLMLRSNLSVDEVAERAGFGSTRTFQRAFRRLEGVTPSAWRDARRP